MAGVAFAVEGYGVGFATESYAASAPYTTLASLSYVRWRIRRVSEGQNVATKYPLRLARGSLIDASPLCVTLFLRTAYERGA